MESRNVPYDSVVLSQEDAQALFAVINRTSGTIHWPSVASDVGTTVEIVRERYMRILSANSATGLVRPQAIITTTTTTTSSGSDDPTTASLINDPPTTSTSFSVTADTTPASNPAAPSTATDTTSTRQATKISDLRPRVLPRLTGEHRKCCFYGYRWCCYAEGCVVHTQCGYDLRVHVKKAHRELAAFFDYSTLVHRSDQEARAWAEGTHMDGDGDDDYNEGQEA